MNSDIGAVGGASRATPICAERPRLHIAPLITSARAEPALVDAADAYLELRDRRHDADYDHLADFTKARVLGLVDLAREATAHVERLRAGGSPELACLLAVFALRTGVR